LCNPNLGILYFLHIFLFRTVLILNERIEEELEKAKAIFGENAFATGFYSYGEISPIVERAKCELLNQTMTITTFNEI
jgi:hypothetical protein